ncbi:hypothetical protein ACQKGI_13010 [Peribacillus muralis]|uniref:hypothetical protein n=1 Tax=Peribacillus muralis TaxID=264697 RepID=UPI0038268CF9
MLDSSDLVNEFQKLAKSILFSELKVRGGKRKYSNISSLFQLNKNVSDESTKLTMTLPNTPLVHTALTSPMAE